MYLVKENEVYKREREVEFSLKEKITFKQPSLVVYEKSEYDWYMTVALEKIDKVTKDRHLLTSELILNYRDAIREGYNHNLDLAIQNQYDHPRNHNTVKGIQNYIIRIQKASDKEIDTANSNK